MDKPKPRVVKDFEKIDPAVLEQIKLAYPYGFAKHLVYFNNRDGVRVSALPFETDDKYYLVRMTQTEAHDIIREDEDYTDGQLRESVRDEYEDKYSELDHMSEYISTDDEEVENIPDDSVDLEDI
jgi:hypothetical protein